MPDKLISDAARDLIVNAEVSGKAHYEQALRHPEWPGESSGVTIGIGYDIGAGVSTKQQLRNDWQGRIPDQMIRTLEPCIGKTGEAAHNLLSSVQSVDVPWSAAIDVFDTVDVPRWSKTCAGHLPNFDVLPLDCKGALLSLAYNRGASFEKAGERYSEMRNIRAHMVAKEFEKIPGEFRSMRRLWTNASNRGVSLRRESEAKLFEQGLRQLNPGPFKPSAVQPATPSAAPPWLLQMNAILGLYEFPGERDNPAIIAMAQACGGQIAKTYKHDAIAWCALTVNWCLTSSGQTGDDSLWALDFGKYGVRLAGPAVGAIATKKRDNGGHVFLVVGKTSAGKIVGRGGNQSDMVCDNLFDPSVIVAYTWPKDYPQPKAVGLNMLPVVTPAPKTQRDVTLPTATPVVKPASAEAPKPAAPPPPAKTTDDAKAGGVLAAIAAAFAFGWAFLQEHLLAIALGALALIGLALIVHRVIKGHWLWTSRPSTGDQSPAPWHLSRPSWGRSSEPSSAMRLSPDLAAELERASEALRAARSPPSSASKRRRKRSAKRSPSSRTRKKSSSSSRKIAATQSSRKRKSRSSG